MPELSLDTDTAGVGDPDNLCDLPGILVKGQRRSVDHDVREASMDGPHGLSEGAAVVLAEGHRNAYAQSHVLDDPAPHVDVGVDLEKRDEDNRGVLLLGGVEDRPHGMLVLDGAGGDAVAILAGILHQANH